MSLWDMGLDTFKTRIVDNKDVNKKIGEGLLQLIEKERQGDTVDRSLLKSLLRMLSDLGMYGDTFESKYDIIDYFSYSIIWLMGLF
jgi:cullin 4